MMMAHYCALSSEALLAYLVKLREHVSTPHEHALAWCSRPDKHVCDVCMFPSANTWA